MKSLIIAAALAASTPALADDLIPTGSSVRIGSYSGVAYYTPDLDGYRLVVTLATKDGPPMRVVATLAEGQMIVLSTPGKLGEGDSQTSILRGLDKITITDLTPATADAGTAEIE